MADSMYLRIIVLGLVLVSFPPAAQLLFWWALIPWIYHVLKLEFADGMPSQEMLRGQSK